MTEFSALLNSIRRPRLLIRAARIGVQDYNRNRDLRRVVEDVQVPSPRSALLRLVEKEAEMEETRKAGDAGYSVSKHVAVLIALLGEARVVTAAETAQAA